MCATILAHIFFFDSNTASYSSIHDDLIQYTKNCNIINFYTSETY